MPSSDQDPGEPYSAVPGGVRVAVRVQPRASRARIDGIEDRGDGAPALKVRVTEPPEDGKANAAVINVLAKAWGLPKGSFAVVAGAKDRNKTIRIAGDPADLIARLRAWRVERPR